MKTYKEWIEEQANNVTTEQAYNAGLKEAKGFYEEEIAGNLEYADSVIRRTSGLDAESLMALVEIADLVPRVGQPINEGEWNAMVLKLQVLKKAVEDKYADYNVGETGPLSGE